MPRGLCVAVAVLFLVAGCSADQKGATPPPPVSQAPSATPSSTPTPTASATPFVTTADEAGAFAFVREYFRVLNSSVASGNLQALQPLRSQSCSCRKLEDDVSRAYRDGGRVEGAQLKVLDLILGESGPAFAKVTAVFSTLGGRTIDGSGRAAEISPVAGNQFVTLVRVGDHWVVDDIKTQVRS